MEEKPMKVDVTTEIDIDRSKVQVAAYASDPNNAPTWYENIKSVEWETPPPLHVGSRIGFVAHFLGRQMVYTYEIVAYVPGDRLVMRTAAGPFPMETEYVWTETNEGSTRMSLRNRGTPAGFFRLAAPFMEWAMRRANRKDLLRLKNLLENEA